jgi:hypothetical protein
LHKGTILPEEALKLGWRWQKKVVMRRGRDLKEVTGEGRSGEAAWRRKKKLKGKGEDEGKSGRARIKLKGRAEEKRYCTWAERKSWWVLLGNIEKGRPAWAERKCWRGLLVIVRKEDLSREKELVRIVSDSENGRPAW